MGVGTEMEKEKDVKKREIVIGPKACSSRKVKDLTAVAYESDSRNVPSP